MRYVHLLSVVLLSSCGAAASAADFVKERTSELDPHKQRVLVIVSDELSDADDLLRVPAIAEILRDYYVLLPLQLNQEYDEVRSRSYWGRQSYRTTVGYWEYLQLKDYPFREADLRVIRAFAVTRTPEAIVTTRAGTILARLHGDVDLLDEEEKLIRFLYFHSGR